MSVFQSKVMYTNTRPTLETERMLSTPAMPAMAVSSGAVISCSTSSGAIPPASACSVTVGLFRSGNTSTGSRASVQAP
jgi:hypothetical protein